MQTAIIIGATSGIGRELAIRLAQAGWTVGVAGRREDCLSSLAEQFPEGTVHTQVLDITAADATESLDDLLQKTGAPDLFLHVSGIGKQNPQIDEALEIQIVETNCTGMVRMASHFMNYVKGNPAYHNGHKAQIAVVTSAAGEAGLGVGAAYSASKKMQSTYISALTQLSRMEHIPVIFTDIRPGFVATEILGPEFDYPIVMPVEKAADHILKGIRKKRRVFTFDWKFRLISVIWRLIPRALWERMTFVRI